MALHDILAAVAAEADKQIAQIKQQHARVIEEAEAKAEQDLQRFTTDIQDQKRRKAEQMKRKAQQRGEQIRRNALLQRKREILDAVYASVLEHLSKESDDALTPLLTAALQQLSGGEIRPATRHAALLKKLAGSGFTIGDPVESKGGFLCVSKQQEHDFRFETIVRDILRHKTELETADRLFSASRA